METFVPDTLLNRFPRDSYTSPMQVPCLLTRIFPSLSFYTHRHQCACIRP